MSLGRQQYYLLSRVLQLFMGNNRSGTLARRLWLPSPELWFWQTDTNKIQATGHLISPLNLSALRYRWLCIFLPSNRSIPSTLGMSGSVSIRLTAALIIRNLVTYSSTAKRTLKRYEPHLANVALSNVEASGVLSHIMYELSQ